MADKRRLGYDSARAKKMGGTAMNGPPATPRKVGSRMHIDPITGFVHHNGSVYTMPMWEAKLEQDAQRAECEASEQKRKDEARAAYEAAVQATLDSAEARKQEALNRHREEVEESRARYRAVCAELKAEVRASRRVQARLSGLIQDYS